MKTFHHASPDFSTRPTAELDALALAGGLVDFIGYGYSTRGTSLERSDDWSAKWVNTQGMGNHGRLVLVARSKRSRALLREGKIRQFMADGLTREQATRVYYADAQYKFELTGVLAEVLADAAMTAAYLRHPRDYGPRSGRSEWKERWGEVIDHRDLSAPREAELAKLVYEVTRP